MEKFVIPMGNDGMLTLSRAGVQKLLSKGWLGLVRHISLDDLALHAEALYYVENRGYERRDIKALIDAYNENPQFTDANKENPSRWRFFVYLIEYHLPLAIKLAQADPDYKFFNTMGVPEPQDGITENFCALAKVLLTPPENLCDISVTSTMGIWAEKILKSRHFAKIEDIKNKDEYVKEVVRMAFQVALDMNYRFADNQVRDIRQYEPELYKLLTKAYFDTHFLTVTQSWVDYKYAYTKALLPYILKSDGKKDKTWAEDYKWRDYAQCDCLQQAEIQKIFLKYLKENKNLAFVSMLLWNYIQSAEVAYDCWKWFQALKKSGYPSDLSQKEEAALEKFAELATADDLRHIISDINCCEGRPFFDELTRYCLGKNPYSKGSENYENWPRKKVERVAKFLPEFYLYSDKSSVRWKQCASSKECISDKAVQEAYLVVLGQPLMASNQSEWKLIGKIMTCITDEEMLQKYQDLVNGIFASLRLRIIY